MCTVAVCMKQSYVFFRSVSREDLMSCVQSGNVAIVLVDWGQLECIWCDKLRCQVSPIFNENQSMMEFLSKYGYSEEK